MSTRPQSWNFKSFEDYNAACIAAGVFVWCIARIQLSDGTTWRVSGWVLGCWLVHRPKGSKDWRASHIPSGAYAYKYFASRASAQKFCRAFGQFLSEVPYDELRFSNAMRSAGLRVVPRLTLVHREEAAS